MSTHVIRNILDRIFSSKNRTLRGTLSRINLQNLHEAITLVCGMGKNGILEINLEGTKFIQYGLDNIGDGELQNNSHICMDMLSNNQLKKIELYTTRDNQVTIEYGRILCSALGASTSISINKIFPKSSKKYSDIINEFKQSSSSAKGFLVIPKLSYRSKFWTVNIQSSARIIDKELVRDYFERITDIGETIEMLHEHSAKTQKVNIVLNIESCMGVHYDDIIYDLYELTVPLLKGFKIDVLTRYTIDYIQHVTNMKNIPWKTTFNELNYIFDRPYTTSLADISLSDSHVMLSLIENPQRFYISPAYKGLSTGIIIENGFIMVFDAYNGLWAPKRINVNMSCILSGRLTHNELIINGIKYINKPLSVDNKPFSEKVNILNIIKEQSPELIDKMSIVLGLNVSIADFIQTSDIEEISKIFRMNTKHHDGTILYPHDYTDKRVDKIPICLWKAPHLNTITAKLVPVSVVPQYIIDNFKRISYTYEYHRYQSETLTSTETTLQEEPSIPNNREVVCWFSVQVKTSRQQQPFCTSILASGESKQFCSAYTNAHYMPIYKDEIALIHKTCDITNISMLRDRAVKLVWVCNLTNPTQGYWFPLKVEEEGTLLSKWRKASTVLSNSTLPMLPDIVVSQLKSLPIHTQYMHDELHSFNLTMEYISTFLLEQYSTPNLTLVGNFTESDLRTILGLGIEKLTYVSSDLLQIHIMEQLLVKLFNSDNVFSSANFICRMIHTTDKNILHNHPDISHDTCIYCNNPTMLDMEFITQLLPVSNKFILVNTNKDIVDKLLFRSSGTYESPSKKFTIKNIDDKIVMNGKVLEFITDPHEFITSQGFSLDITHKIKDVQNMSGADKFTTPVMRSLNNLFDIYDIRIYGK